MKIEKKNELSTLIYNGYLKYKVNTRIQTLFKLIPIENNDNMVYFLINPNLIIKDVSLSIPQRMGYDVNKADTEAFIKVLSKKYKTISNLINYCNATTKTLHKVIMEESQEYLTKNCRTYMNLLDYYNEFKFDKDLIKYHSCYSVEIEVKDKIRGKVGIDNCRVGFGYTKDLIEIRTFERNNDIFIDSDDAETLKQIKIYYYDDNRK